MKNLLKNKICRIVVSLPIPLVFSSLAFYYFGVFEANYSVDGWALFNSIRAIIDGYGYTGNAALFWPPVYSLISAPLGIVLGVENAAATVSILSAVGFLIILPLLSKKLVDTYTPGVFCQALLAINPQFFTTSLQLETHMLDAFLFLLSVLLILNYIKQGYSRFPWKIIVFSSLACLTRYPSVLIVLTFYIFLWGNYGKGQIKSHITKISYTFGVIFLPWLFYNYFWNRVLPVLSGSQYDMVGVSFIDNSIFDMTIFAWASLYRFNYEGFLGFAISYPMRMLQNVFWNFLRILYYLAYNYPFIGLFSVLMLPGLIDLISEREEDKKFFLLTLVASSLLIVVVTADRPVYFLKYSVLLFIPGTDLLIKKLQKVTRKSSLKIIFTISVLALATVFQFGSWWGNHKEIWAGSYHFPHYSYKGPNVSKKVRGGLESIRKEDDSPGPVRVMNWKFSFQVHQAGLKPVFGLIPRKSALELFCYKHLSEERLSFHMSFNYPPGKPKSFFIPPDYLLLDERSKLSLSLSERLGFVDLIPYMASVDSWEENLERKGIRLYRVKKDKLPCT